MKTILRPKEPPKDEEVHVGCTADNGKVHIYGSGACHAWRRSFDPAQAVKLWRCLTGKCCTATPDDIHGDTMKLWSHVDPNRGSLWELSDASGERLFCLDADQAMALAWAIVKCCTVALSTSTPDSERPCDKEPKPLRVWVLAAKWMVVVDRTKNVSTQLGGEERVFLTKEAALDALREFLRQLVNEDNRNTIFDVDRVIDNILGSDSADETEWTYDGSDLSFRVTLYERKVEYGE